MKIGMLFPGYASQFVGMGKELYDDSRIMQEYFEEASNCLNVNFVKLCFASSDAELSKMGNAYTSLFLVSSSIAAILASVGIKADVVAGYNTGEYAAMHAAGGLSLPDGLYLLNKYAAFYQEFLATTPIAVARVSGISAENLEAMCKEFSEPASFVSIVIYNGADDFYIAGHEQAVAEISGALQQQKLMVKNVTPEIGLHGPLVEQIAAQFKMYLEKVDFKDITPALLNSSTARKISNAQELRDYTVSRIYEPIRWDLMMAQLHKYDLLLEIGPGQRLSEVMLKHYPKAKIHAINKQADIDELLRIVNGVKTNQDETKE